MATQVQKKPVLITLTSPTAGGKSFLFNFIRDEAKLPCLISTTTRAPRVGEVDGLDYYFISEEESKQMEEANMFAELNIYNGVRYGVTKTEFNYKLGQEGMAFLIVEPAGAKYYEEYVRRSGVLQYKAFIHTDPEVRLERFRERVKNDMERTIANAMILSSTYLMREKIMKEMNTALNRITTMLTDETKWFGSGQWDRVLFGEEKPADNLQIILSDVTKIQQQRFEKDTIIAAQKDLANAEMHRLNAEWNANDN